ncbi:hypothetical protein GCM10009721_25290 [Terrabacter tumescens]|uniref:Uncharacterized protein n=1 Tax=Terrabacter tumescens TaxID=60443 RepID=A0ABQ2I3H6_9MICO|nr:hypothetical protein [Terrabacter tumescens]GGM97277.1 hypothetical protein GCM10009721_25290 [Terrabacter tumescens]
MSGGGNLPVGPGIWGFIAFFVLALALWFLVRNMNSRLRRMAYRDRDRAEEFAANAEVDGSRRVGADAATPADQSTAPTTPGEPDSPAERGDDPDARGEATRP